MRKKRAAPARKAKAGSKRAKAKAKPKAGLHLPAGLEQRHLDLIGLFLVAFGVYLVFVLFAGWEGGKVGYGVETGLVYLFGTVGARIFTILMLLVGGMLLTGTSVSTLAHGVGRGLHAIFRGIFFSGTETARTVAKSHADWREQREARAEETEAGPTDVMSAYPEDDEDFEPTVALAEEDSFDDAIFDIESEAEAETEAIVDGNTPDHEIEDSPVEAEEPIEPAQAALTPMGNTRGVTTSDEIDYRPPPASSLERGKGDKGPDPRDQEITGRKLVETLGHFGVEAKIVGVISGPHVSRYELRLAPGIKVKKVTELANDLAYSLASTDIRILAPIPGKQAVGVEVPERPPPDRPPRRHLRRPPGEDLAAGRLARQGHRRQPGLDRPGEDAARPRRRHHRLRQVRLRQRDPLLDPDAGLAERGPPGSGRPEAGRAQPLRERAAPADPGGHLAAPGRQRPLQPDRRDGDPLRDHERGPLPQPGRAQPPSQEEGRRAAAAHPLRDRRARGPDDGRPGRSRGLDHPPGAEVARHRDPPGAGDPASLDRHHHRHDQGQHPGPDRLRRLLPDRLPRDPRPGRGGGAAGPGRHALPRRRQLEAAARPGRLHHRGRDRPDHQPLGQAGRTGIRGRAAGDPGGGRRGGPRRRLRPRQRRPARRGDPARRPDRDRLGIDDPAPPAGRLHPRRSPDRHARAPRRHLRLRGVETAPGADHPGRSQPRPGARRASEPAPEPVAFDADPDA